MNLTSGLGVRGRVCIPEFFFFTLNCYRPTISWIIFYRSPPPLPSFLFSLLHALCCCLPLPLVVVKWKKKRFFLYFFFYWIQKVYKVNIRGVIICYMFWPSPLSFPFSVDARAILYFLLFTPPPPKKKKHESNLTVFLIIKIYSIVRIHKTRPCLTF